MTKLILNLFINEKEKKEEKYNKIGSIIGLISNIALFISKLIIGIMTKSVSIGIDAFNNLSDSLTIIITFIGYKLSKKPEDEEHPFGHGRIEYISSFIVSVIILLVGIEFLKGSIIKIIKPEDLKYSKGIIIALIITVIIKIWQSKFYKYIGKEIKSKAFIATSIDSRNDAIITSSTILTLLVFEKLKVNIDGYIGLLLSGIILQTGVKLIKETLSPLIGEAIDGELVKKIREIALSYEDILGVHDILLHNYGVNKNIGSLHAEISKEKCINKAHETIDEIEDRIKKELGVILTIHIDPINTKDKRLKKITKKLKEIYKKNGDKISSHDHRIVDGEKRINIIFDLVIPHKFSKKETENLIKEIKENIKEIDDRYNCVINIEKNFIK